MLGFSSTRADALMALADSRRSLYPDSSMLMCRKNVDGLAIVVAEVTVVAVLLAGAAAPAAPVEYRLEFDHRVSLDIEATANAMPVSIARDAISGDLCITDTRQVAFHLLNEHEVPVFRSRRIAGLSLPQDGCVDGLGRIVFTDRDPGGTTTIRRLTVLGEPDDFTLEPPAERWSPGRLLVTVNGDYVALDPASGLLTRHDPETGALRWARHCRPEGLSGEQLGRPAEAPDGRLYIPGGDLRRVLVCSAEGVLEGSFGRFGSAPGRMVMPVAIDFGPGGEVLVLDRLRARILVYGPDHRFITEFGSLGLGPGQFYHPLSLAVSDEGRVYVTQGFEGRVQVFQLAASTMPSDRTSRSASQREEATGKHR